MSIDRRELLAGAAALATLAGLPRAFAAEETASLEARRAAAELAGVNAHKALMAVPGVHMHGSEKIALLIYPGFTALDLFGPHAFLVGLMGAELHLVAKTAEPVLTDSGVAVTPTATFAEVPEQLDLLLVPGGAEGTVAAAQDAETRAFVRSRGLAARHVASVCTGTLILGAAGLLAGRRVTSHWGVRDTLETFGARPVDQRVVFDGRLVTGAGVSAGLDLGLALVGLLRGRPMAEAGQLMNEYAPAPPYQAGTPARAPAAIREPVYGMLASLRLEAELLAQQAKALYPATEALL